MHLDLSYENAWDTRNTQYTWTVLLLLAFVDYSHSWLLLPPFVDCLLWARHFTSILKMRKQGSESLSNLPKLTNLVVRGINGLSFLFKKYLFGCVRSYLWHVGSFLDALGLVVGASRLSCSASTWSLRALMRDRICIPCIARQILIDWTTREVSGSSFLINYFYFWILKSSTAWHRIHHCPHKR